ncbi:response regulator transcription factor [Chelativorans sp. YIM 93263]|uniref:response regulator transcription factor n=1 Tax=Chelativorans sp. YIM 93263 TaxID=2906648 RepID=UPI002379A55D|nr:response regulator transcription factor [Chelativorans sp. YIM 93263]
MEQHGILLVKRQPIVLEGLMRIFGEDETYRLVHADLDTTRTFDLAVKHRPEVVLMDCVDWDHEIRMISKIVIFGIKVLVFPTVTKIDYAIKAIEAGAGGYLAAECTGDEVKDAVAKVVSGETFISPGIAGKVIVSMRHAEIRKAAERRARLSTRERQVAELLLKGGTNKEIANKLGLTENTVKHYMTVLLQKHSVKNRLELANALRQAEAAGSVNDAWRN